MNETQLQLRIMTSVINNKNYFPETFFLKFRIHPYSKFIEGNTFFSKFSKEEDVKTGETYEEIKPAVQKRLFLMDSDKRIFDTLDKYGSLKEGNYFLKKRGSFRLKQINLRNDRMIRKVLNSNIKRKGGLPALVFKDFFENIFSKKFDFLSYYIK